jgi:mannose-6-phosphate isomerase-like protein (cupin superfamily)
MAADDVAAALADVAVSDPRRGIIEIAGPEAAPMDEIVRRFFEAQGDSRKVIGDRSEPYFGTPIDAQSLTPGPGARLGRICSPTGSAQPPPKPNSGHLSRRPGNAAPAPASSRSESKRLPVARGRITPWHSLMKTFSGYKLITPDDLHWRPSNLMKIPNADFLERTGSENMGARLWRMPPWSANTLHKHIRAEEFYFVLEGTGRLRIGEETVTVPKHGGVLVGPDQLRQVFNDSDEDVLWLIIGAPEEMEFLKGSLSDMDLSLIYPQDPTQLPKELDGVVWPPKD